MWPYLASDFQKQIQRVIYVTCVVSIAVCLCFSQTNQAVPVTAQPQLTQGTQNAAKLKIKAAVVDNDLNVKPVPKLKLLLRSKVPDSPEISLSTNFDGTAEIDVPTGSYDLRTAQSLQFQGRHYSWVVSVTVPPQGLVLDLSVDNAKIEELTVSNPARRTDELTTLFQKFQPSVVTVWSEFGHGTGFLVDPKGLVLTNQHVIGPSEYIAVQFDSAHKLEAKLLSSDPEKDIAVLWVNLTTLKGWVVTPFPPTGAEPTVVEGERVFTIGSPLSQRKIMTTGIVSKVEKRAIISDININPGNSGGPLFNSLGYVVGLTTFGEGSKQGPGLSGIVRIEEAFPVLELARQKMATVNPPSTSLLPVEPDQSFPLDAIKSSLQGALKQKHFYEDVVKPHYFYEVGDYEVAVITPPVKYYIFEHDKLAAVKSKESRNRRPEAVQGTFRPLDDLRNWAEYAGEYKPVLEIRAQPKLRETAGSAWTRAMISPALQARVRFKTDFYKMVLKCDGKEIQPIHPAKVAHVVSVKNRLIDATDATYEGYYVYPPDAISSKCDAVTLELFSEKKPDKAKVMDFKSTLLDHVVEDFSPYTNDKVDTSRPRSTQKCTLRDTSGC